MWGRGRGNPLTRAAAPQEQQHGNRPGSVRGGQGLAQRSHLAGAIFLNSLGRGGRYRSIPAQVTHPSTPLHNPPDGASCRAGTVLRAHRTPWAPFPFTTPASCGGASPPGAGRCRSAAAGPQCRLATGQRGSAAAAVNGHGCSVSSVSSCGADGVWGGEMPCWETTAASCSSVIIKQLTVSWRSAVCCHPSLVAEDSGGGSSGDKGPGALSQLATTARCTAPSPPPRPVKMAFGVTEVVTMG
ncbi:uncharacterized protein ACIBXB_021887 [Morphnus guianensis]